VSDLQGSSISLAGPPQLLWGDASSGSEAGAAAQTWVNTLQVDRGVSFEVSLLLVNVCALVPLRLIPVPLETVVAAWACRNSMAGSTSRPATSYLESMVQHVQVAPLALLDAWHCMGNLLGWGIMACALCTTSWLVRRLWLCFWTLHFVVCA
jgi:hypothetical protein